MRVVVQRVKKASVEIEGQVVGDIQNGLLVLLGIEHEDGQDDAKYLIQKLTQLRIFSDADGKMNLSIQDIGGQFLVVSQFTLLANTHKGNRPSYIESAAPDIAKKMYEDFTNSLAQFTQKKIQN